MGLKLEIGCKNFRYGKLVETINGVTGKSTYAVEAIKKLKGLKTVVINTDSELKDVWGDDVVLEVLSSGLTKPTLEIGVLEINKEFTAEAFGYEKVNGSTKVRGNEIPNDLAIMFEATISDGTVVHYSFYKAKCVQGAKDFNGKEAGVSDPKPKSLTFNFMSRSDVDAYYGYIESDDPDFVLRDVELETFGKSDIPAA